MMNVDHILATMNSHQVDCILIGGMNFLLRHTPIVTYDVDLWVDDTSENLDRCQKALCQLGAEWGPSEAEWEPVAVRKPGWLHTQSLFCLTSPHGAIDVFRSVEGLKSWAACRARAQADSTAGGVAFVGLSDEDMLQCQLALPEGQRNQARIGALKKALGQTENE